MRRFVVVIGVLACASCRIEPAVDQPTSDSSSESAESEVGVPEAEGPEPEPPEIPPLACSVEFGPERDAILVAGQPTPIEFDPDLDFELVAYPAAEGEVLVAVGYADPWLPDRNETGQSLWRVGCTEPNQAKRVVELPGAEFPFSVLSSDGQHIYFSYGDLGVHSYTIATGQVAPLIQPRTISDCWMHEDEGDVAAEEFVQGWLRPGELLVFSGGPCGFEAEWQGELHIVSDFQRANQQPKRRPRAWIGTVMAGAGSRVWAGDGGQCSLDSASMRSGTAGVWRSEDAGAHWTFLPLKGVEAGVEWLWPSASDPDRVLAVTECCTEALGCQHNGGGSLFLTTDGGTTWRKIRDESNESGIEGLLIDEANHELTVRGSEGVMVTRDDGRKWKPSSAALAPLAASPTRVEIGGFILERTEDGLERHPAKAPAGTGEIVLRPGH